MLESRCPAITCMKMECLGNKSFDKNAVGCDDTPSPATDVDVFPDLSSSAARKQLEPFHARIVAAIHEGVRRFNSIPATLLYPMVKWKRVKANGVWAFIVEEIENTFRDVPGIKVVPRHGSVEIEIGTNTVARIKKMRPDGLTSNYQTKRVKEFHSDAQGELFEQTWAQPMKLDIGYIEDETGTRVVEVMVARRDRPNHVAWTYPMTAPAAVTSLPFEVTAPAAAIEATTEIVGRKAEGDNEAQGTDDA
jgi:hypothetical protein